MKYVTTIGDQQFTIDINHAGEIIVDGEIIHVDMLQTYDKTIYSAIIEGKSHDIRMNEGDGVYLVQLSGDVLEVVVEDERTRRLAGLKGGMGAHTGEAVIKAPMPGIVIEVPVEVGQEVEIGQIVVILESMKMQNEFKSPLAGHVSTIRVAPGDKVDQNAVMLIISEIT